MLPHPILSATSFLFFTTLFVHHRVVVSAVPLWVKWACCWLFCYNGILSPPHIRKH